MTFDRFVAIDWTGARGERHAAIAVAECAAGTSAPRLVTRDRRWSRGDVLDWITAMRDAGERALIGFDFSFGFPHADAGAFFPGEAAGPVDARALWREIDTVAAADPHLEAHTYVAHRRAHFWLGDADGPKAARARLRRVEHVWAAKKRGAASSVFALLGAAQCGKASLSGMRLLAQAGVPVWPFDPIPAAGPLIVEIYCRTFAAEGGVRGKIRDGATLDAALGTLGSDPAGLVGGFADHVGDALVSAAGMRRIAADPAWWSPPGLTPDLAQTEGWTFGVA